MNNNQKTYSCGICKTTPDQISHHKAHLETQKHKDKRDLFQMKLTQNTPVELEQKFGITNVCEIVKETETVLYSTNDIKLKIPVAELVNIQSFDEQQQQKLKNEIMEQYNAVSNKEALKDKIHEIHNYLRNNGAGYGMNGMKVFNLIFGIKKIEEAGLIDKIGLKRPECEFSYLLDLANRGENEHLYETIKTPVLNSIYESEIKHLLFYEIPTNIRSSVMVFLVKEINKITLIEKTCNVLLSGKIYEYFIGRDESAISELGAYFTDRHIVDFALNKLNPVLEPDGSVGTMVDPFGGSGGFTTGYINYLNQKFPGQICWETELAKISHYDINEDVIKSAGLEFFCLTGVLPNPQQMFYKNSFTDDFGGRKYKYPLTNPPYGGDKANKTEAQNKREKIRDYIKADLATITDEAVRIRRQKQLKDIEAQEKQERKESEKSRVCLATCSNRINRFAFHHGKLKGNDKESCSLILLMDIVAEGGTALGVLKEGVFFNRQYMDLRKCLIENFNVREVISIPQDQFENTSTKTSILIFDNTPGKTTQEVCFSELTVERYAQDRFVEVMGDVVIAENRGDIRGVSDRVVSVASREDLLSNPLVSLNGKDYGKKTLVLGEGYETVKLGDICESLSGYAFKTQEYKDEGVPLITITHIKNEKIAFNGNHYIEENEKYSKYEIKKDDVIISLTGKKPTLCSIAINDTDEKRYLNQRCGLLRNFKQINNCYFAGIFNAFILNYINENIGNGSNQENVSLKDVLNVPVPIPKSPEKIREWVERISLPYNKKNECQTKIKKLETDIQDKIKYINENEECDEVELGSICEKIKPTFNLNTADMDKTGPFPFYSKVGLSIGLHSEYNYDLQHCIVLTKDGGSGPNIYGENIALGGVMLIKGKFASTYANFVLLPKNHIHFVYYSLKQIKNKIMDLANYSVKIGHIQYDKLAKIKIKIPRNKQVLDDLEPTFKEIENQQQLFKQAEEQYKQLIQELAKEAIPEQIPVAEENLLVDTDGVVVQDKPIANNVEPFIEQTPVVTKKKVMRKKQVAKSTGDV